MTNDRLKVLLYNAIVLLEEDAFNDIGALQEELGMTPEEYQEIMGE